MDLKNFHERFPHEETTVPGSDRAFGLLFAAVFAIVAAWPTFNGSPPAIWSIVLATVLVAISIGAPWALRPFNAIWLMLGSTLAHVMSPFALGLLYYGAFVPTGILMRVAGKDPLHRKLESEAKSYWIEREHSSNEVQDMRNQY